MISEQSVVIDVRQQLILAARLAVPASPGGGVGVCHPDGRRIPTLMVAGTADTYCPADEFRKLEARFPWIETVSIEGADHFFFGKLFPLGQAVAEWARRRLPARGAG